MPIRLDVRNKDAHITAREAVVSRWGRIDVLVNNAALTQARPLLDITVEDLRDVIGINLIGTFYGCQVFGEHMANSEYGRIVNIASMAGQSGGSGTGGHYATSKGGILTLTKVFAKELAGAGVTVNAVAPGPLDHPLVREVIPPERMQSFVESIPVRRLGSIEFVAEVVSMLARRDAASVCGACWDVNGGLSMR